MEDNRETIELSKEKSRAETPDRLSDDQLYRALASTKRRRLLCVLLEEERNSVGDLATILTGWNATEEGTTNEPDDRNRIVVELIHTHLPLLDEIGLVTYDSEGGTVELEPLDPILTDLIQRSVEAEPSSLS